jgi:hypothetical protein
VKTIPRAVIAILALTAVPLTAARPAVRHGPFPTRVCTYTTGAGTAETEPYTVRYLRYLVDVSGRFSTALAIEVIPATGLVLPGTPAAGALTHR